MSAGKKLAKAIILYGHHQDLLDQIDDQLCDLIGDDAHIFKQASDGWVICHHDQYNTRVTPDQLNELLKMTRGNAIQWLMQNTI